MNSLRVPVPKGDEKSKDSFRRPEIPMSNGSTVGVTRSLRDSRKNSLTTSNISTISEMASPVAQAGCSTLRAGGYRKKVSLKPGHSALDWYDLVSKSKARGLATGVEKLINEDFETLASINNPHSLLQLRNGVPLYLIKPTLKINKELLRKHNGPEDCWGVINGKVYSMTHYFEFHPGGADILFKHCAGKDGTGAFNKYHRWVSVDKLLETSFVGTYTTDN